MTTIACPACGTPSAGQRCDCCGRDLAYVPRRPTKAAVRARRFSPILRVAIGIYLAGALAMSIASFLVLRAALGQISGLGGGAIALAAFVICAEPLYNIASHLFHRGDPR